MQAMRYLSNPMSRLFLFVRFVMFFFYMKDMAIWLHGFLFCFVTFFHTKDIVICIIFCIWHFDASGDITCVEKYPEIFDPSCRWIIQTLDRTSNRPSDAFVLI